MLLRCRSLEADNSPQFDPLLYGWLMDTTLKSVHPFTLPTGIQLAPDSFGVAERVASPAVKGIVDFGYTVYSSLCMFWFLCKFKKVICPAIIFKLDSTIAGEIWQLKSPHSEFTRFPVKTYVSVPRWVNIRKFWNFTFLFKMADILKFSLI
jgi:hypothetical protein